MMKYFAILTVCFLVTTSAFATDLTPPAAVKQPTNNDLSEEIVFKRPSTSDLFDNLMEKYPHALDGGKMIEEHKEEEHRLFKEKYLTPKQQPTTDDSDPAEEAEKKTVKFWGFEIGTGGFLDSYLSLGHFSENGKKSYNRGQSLSRGAVYAYAQKELTEDWKIGGRIKANGYLSNRQNPDASGELTEGYVMASSETYGRIMAGYLENSSQMMGYDAPDVGGLGVNNSAFHQLMIQKKEDNTYLPVSTLLDSGNQNLKAVYISPTVYDTEIGFSYLTEGNSRKKFLQVWETPADFKRALLVSVHHLYEDDSFSIGTTGSYGYYWEHRKDRKEYSLSGQITYLDFVLAGGYRKIDYETSDLPSAFIYNIGIKYDNHLFGVGIAYEKAHTKGENKASRLQSSVAWHYTPDVDLFLSYAHIISQKRQQADIGLAGFSVFF